MTEAGRTPSPCGDRDKAAYHARKAIELDENDPWAHMALGYLAFTNRRTDDAVRHFQAAIDLNPNFAAAYGYVGWACKCLLMTQSGHQRVRMPSIESAR
jgi:Flp pilus assembly protein TadD